MTVSGPFLHTKIFKMNTIKINGQDMPFKMTNRARSRIEVNLNFRIVEIADNLTINVLNTLAYEALREGWMIQQDSRDPNAFPMSMDDFMHYDAKAKESHVDKIIKATNELGKKPKASTQTDTM